MSKNGLTMTIVFVAESANYGEGLGNISNIKKMTRGNASQYSYTILYSRLSGITHLSRIRAELYSLLHQLLLRITQK